ncbi:MAG: hypothetical protein LBS03_05920 [Bacteroidales bacterium]|jgi:hypothetical protein|nr:hypothetical protein [Bacteroidales bacterium]
MNTKTKIKKLFVLLLVFSGNMSIVHAQPSLSKGSGLVNVGVGVVPGVGGNVSYDYGLIDYWGPGLFTVGGYLSVSAYDKRYEGIDRRDRNYFLSPRATYRYSVNSRFEVFGSVMIGLLITDDNYGYPLDISLGIMAGCRFFVTDNVGFFAEGGVNIRSTCFNGGLTIAF